MAIHNELGRLGEQLAKEYLLNKGFTVLAQNYRFEKAELDLICVKNEDIVFVEVKTRSSNYYASPIDAVHLKKQELLKEAAFHFITENKIELEPRFDIIAIVIQNEVPQIEHLEDAFWG
jgi:putative endonuclease